MSIQDLADSPFNELMGFAITDWREDHVVVELQLQNKHLNRSGVVHGGVLATLIDAAGGFAGCYCTVPGNVRRALSLSLTTNFTGQTRSGQVRAVARRSGGGRKVFFSAVEVFADDGTLLAFGSGSYRYRSGSETREGAPPGEDAI